MLKRNLCLKDVTGAVVFRWRYESCKTICAIFAVCDPALCNKETMKQCQPLYGFRNSQSLTNTIMGININRKLDLRLLLEDKNNIRSAEVEI